MKMLKEQKAQSSIELLLLIGGAIVLATIVGVIIKGLASAPGGEISQGVQDTLQDLG
jgi:uncharacterized protein (UPF0333 family)